MIAALAAAGLLLGCQPVSATAWKITVDDKWEVSLTPQFGGPRGTTIGPADVTVTDRTSGDLAFTIELPRFTGPSVAVSADGGLIAFFREGEECEGCERVVVYDKDGKRLGDWTITEHLTKDEQARLSRSRCGTYWKRSAKFEEGTLVIDVIQNGKIPALEGAPFGGPGVEGGSPIELRIDTTKGAITRTPAAAKD